MNAKKKIASSLFTMFSMILIVVMSIILSLSVKSIQNRANAESFRAYGVSATISGNYYVGKTAYKMYSEDKDTIVFDSYDEESFPALDPADQIKLSAKNNYVVFEYIFTNTSDDVSFVVSMTNIAEIINMDVTYGYSYKKLDSFDTITLSQLDNVPLIAGDGNTLYFYIKAQISNSNKKCSLSGAFCFSLISEEIYEINLIEGDFNHTAYATLGYQLQDVQIPILPGYKFEGYFTKPQGQGEMIYDENGKSEKVWIEANGTTLYAHFSKI